MKGTCLVLAAAAGAFVSPSAVATFHFMQIEQVIGGVNGDPSAQAIQLRTRTAHQNLVLQARMVVVDATGANPVEIIDFTTNAPNPAAGARILITSPNFIDALDGPLAPDFTMTNLIPPGYLAAGSLTFESDGGSVYWRLSWGGAAYTGPNNGACANDDSPCPNGDFGPPWPMALPSTSEQALQFQGPFNAVSTTNADDYEVTVRAATFFNNAGESATVERVCPWDCQNMPDGNVGIADFLEMLSQWGGPGVCDFDGSGVGITDFLELLAAWGPCKP